MKIRQDHRTGAVLQEIGARLQRLRLQQNRTLAEVASAAGLGPATLQRIEAGANVNLKSLVQVLRVLNRLSDLDSIIADIEVSPFEVSHHSGTPRRRASPPDE
jgi:transcriptional regulator with XRE-family HTH domain